MKNNINNNEVLVSDSSSKLNGSKRVSNKDKLLKQDNKNITIIIAGILLIMLLIGFIAFGQYKKSQETVVPSAAATISVESSEKEVCAPFSNAEIKCKIKWKTNDEIDRGSLISQSVASGEVVNKGDTVSLAYSSGPAETIFPNLTNVPVDEAKEILYENGLNVESINVVDGSGQSKNTVVNASVAPETVVKNGQNVILEVAKGTTNVPDWTSKTREVVEADANNLNLDVEFKEEESDQPAGIILSQSVVGETDQDDKVIVVLSKSFESKDVVVPDVIGKSVSESQVDLASAGFRHIKTVVVKNSEVTSPQVTQVVPGVGQTGKSEENIVLIVSEPYVQ